MIERTENIVEISGKVFHQILAVKSFKLFDQVILEGTFGGYVCGNSRLKNSWISSGYVSESILEDCLLNDCEISNCNLCKIQLNFSKLFGETIRGGFREIS
jgi:hypothetical protein